MSEVTLSPETLQQIASLASAGPEEMHVDEGAELSQAVREIASQMKGRTEILAGALQGVATSTQGISDRVTMLEQQLTESNQREQMLMEQLQAFKPSLSHRRIGCRVWNPQWTIWAKPWHPRSKQCQ